MSLSDYLNGVVFKEGFSQQKPQQVYDLISLTSKPNLNIMEIGFHAGHSADLFLKNNPSVTLTSFELLQYNYTLAAKQYIDASYPKRHTLIIGDSRVSVPSFINSNKNTKFDVVFIDGGHDYDVANSDLENCFHLAHKDTIVMMDDIAFEEECEAPWTRRPRWTIGPTRAWTKFIKENKIIELNRVEYVSGRGMSWGKYVF